MLSPKQCRAFDQFLIEDCKVPGILLMENAGRNCADFILRQHADSAQKHRVRATILCGGGNNGGDGFVIARHLLNAAAQVQVIHFPDRDRYSGDARTMLDWLSLVDHTAIRFPATEEKQALRQLIGFVDGQPVNWIVDAMLGTGANGDLKTDMASAVQVANGLDAIRFAVDVPSGLDPSLGTPTKTVFRADYCGTFVAKKTGFSNPLAQPYLGSTRVLDIGFTPASCGWSPPSDE